MKVINLPINENDLKQLRAGDCVYFNGTMYTARDAAHKRICEMLKNSQEPPFDLKNSAIYYVGPTPSKPDEIIGSCGPTSSYRMDAYVEPLLKQGLKVMIGKGPRSQEVKDLLKTYGAVYLSAIGGTGALIQQSVTKCQVIAFEDLDSEAVRKLQVENFFAIVTYDMYGGDLFTEQIQKYKTL